MNNYKTILIIIIIIAVKLQTYIDTKIINTLQSSVSSTFRNEYNGPIDIVYTWVNGDDQKWVNKRDSYSNTSLAKNKDAASSIRFQNIDELKYSLRSIYKYAPWINNIYIVTDNQVPEWLNTKHEKIHIIDHKDIFDVKEDLPVFNSQAIECHLHKIPNLTEVFLYFNDDCFLGNHLCKKDIVTSNGMPYYFEELWNCNYSGAATNNDIGYVAAWKNNNQIINNDFPNRKQSCPWHQGQVCTKSMLKFLENKYNTWFRNTSQSKFRKNNNIAPIGLSAVYAMEANKSLNIIKPSNMYFRADNINRKKTQQYINKLFETKPQFFCINNICPNKPNIDLIINFFDDYFKEKSPYEL